GNALNVGRTMRVFERAGASAIQLEDQAFPKRCGHLDGKVLIPAIEMAGKIKAALDSRRSRETLVIARTDAIAVEGFERAIARGRYSGEGRHVCFSATPQRRAGTLGSPRRRAAASRYWQIWSRAANPRRCWRPSSSRWVSRW